MQMELAKSWDLNPIGKLAVVRNFRRVIEARDISLMNKELYQFLNLYCGFIAHYDINGFKAANTLQSRIQGKAFHFHNLQRISRGARAGPQAEIKRHLSIKNVFPEMVIVDVRNIFLYMDQFQIMRG